MNDWQVGDRVVCVSDEEDMFITSGVNWRPGLDGLIKGRTYTIRSLCRSHITGAICVRLVEIVRPLGTGDPDEGGFNALRFRKVQPRKTDISVFTKMLNDARA